jgi:hypothetical protein
MALHYVCAEGAGWEVALGRGVGLAEEAERRKVASDATKRKKPKNGTRITLRLLYACVFAR